MVIVILSMTSMMVVPSFFSTSSASLDDEAHRFVQTLRLAQDEAILSGEVLRISLRSHSYAFQSLNNNGEWVPFNLEPYQDYKLMEGIRLDQIDPHPQLTDESNEPEDDPVFARLFLPPEGINQIADITLLQTSNETEAALVVQFRPGPGGIRIVKDESMETR